MALAIHDWTVITFLAGQVVPYISFQEFSQIQNKVDCSARICSLRRRRYSARHTASCPDQRHAVAHDHGKVRECAVRGSSLERLRSVALMAWYADESSEPPHKKQKQVEQKVMNVRNCEDGMVSWAVNPKNNHYIFFASVLVPVLVSGCFVLGRDANGRGVFHRSVLDSEYTSFAKAAAKQLPYYGIKLVDGFEKRIRHVGLVGSNQVFVVYISMNEFSPEIEESIICPETRLMKVLKKDQYDVYEMIRNHKMGIR